MNRGSPDAITEDWTPPAHVLREDDVIAPLHAALLDLDRELTRRMQIHISHGPGADVGPVRTIRLREMPWTAARLADHWNRVRTPGEPERSPALAAITRVARLGRVVGLHLAVEHLPGIRAQRTRQARRALLGRLRPGGAR